MGKRSRVTWLSYPARIVGLARFVFGHGTELGEQTGSELRRPLLSVHRSGEAPARNGLPNDLAIAMHGEHLGSPLTRRCIGLHGTPAAIIDGPLLDTDCAPPSEVLACDSEAE